MSASTIFVAQNPEQIRRCHPVMQQLRPHLNEEAFVAQIIRQQREGFHLVGLESEGVVRAAAGYRILEMLAYGRHLYIDDLITDEQERSKGWGEQLFLWLKQHAKEQGCLQLQLDSGTFRHGAHRFYFRQGMHIFAYHFNLKL